VTTTEQQDRLLGQVCRGVSTDAAACAVGLTPAEVFALMDSDPAFRLALFIAQQSRDGFAENMERLQE
jgi:hypothetical protein